MSGISWLNKGVLSVITGPMFSGKTEELIKRVNIFKRTNKKILVFKFLFDNKYDCKNFIISHYNENKIEVYPIKTTTEFKEILKQNDDFCAIAFDEVQFLPLSFFPIIKELIKNNKTVICSGLDKDYWNQYTGLLAHLLVIADVVDKYFAICSICDNIATHSQRIKNSKVVDYNYPKRMIENFDAEYQPRCKKCFIEFDRNKYE